MTDPRPVGVLDSGMGGLSVLREVHALLPAEHLHYVADSGFVPYGERSEDEIRERVGAITRFLLGANIKALVVACNTATAAAVPWLREQLAFPVIGMEPAVKPAAAVSSNGTVGVLATSGTLSSSRFAALLDRYGQGLHVITQPCPGLVDAVERGDLHSTGTRELLNSYLEPLLHQGADTVILGCTHYPFLRPVLRELLPPSIRVIDTGPAVARQLQRRLQEDGLLNMSGQAARICYWTSGDPDAMRRFVSANLDAPLQGEVLCWNAGQAQGALP
ncbi:MAG: glutamate racemase [Ectothiorhodospiraceae bacterium]|nr:glutamate racemase [Ectothiorhodospiraceae bacterium]MCH8503181.1 glutamate racemase [Ectothiorhodospiraceae bacterium]